MKEQIDHLRCSELLPAFLDGTLGPSDAAAVEAHLSSCDECRAERRGLELLRAEEPETLSALERGTLERGVMAGIAQDADSATVVPLPTRRSFPAKLAGALGAAAVLVAVGTFFYLGGSGGEDGVPALSGGDTAEQEESGAVADRSRARDEKRRAAKASGESVQGASIESAPDATAATELRAAPAPTFRIDREPLTGADLQKRGESSLESVRFAAAYSANEADGGGGGGNTATLLEQLVQAAENRAGSGVADQVDECARQVLDSNDPTIPTFGSIGVLNGDRVLILGFAWSRRSSGPLDRYMVWAWERGSCDVVVDFVDGRIETAN